MSNVTNILLSDDSCHNDVLRSVIMTQLNLIRLDNDNVGGTKCLENDLYIGAFNYLKLDEFILSMREVFKDVQTDHDVQLLVKEQDDCKWREVTWEK